MVGVRLPKSQRAKRELLKWAPKLVIFDRSLSLLLPNSRACFDVGCGTPSAAGRSGGLFSSRVCFSSSRLFSLVMCQVEIGKKTLILHGTKTSATLNSVLTDIHHLKRDNAVKYSTKNDNVRPFESGGETSLEFFSHKTDCSLIVVKNVTTKDPDQGKSGRVYIPDQKVAKLGLSNNVKGLKRERHEAKKNKEDSKKQKIKPSEER